MNKIKETTLQNEIERCTITGAKINEIGKERLYIYPRNTNLTNSNWITYRFTSSGRCPALDSDNDSPRKVSYNMKKDHPRRIMDAPSQCDSYDRNRYVLQSIIY